MEKLSRLSFIYLLLLMVCFEVLHAQQRSGFKKDENRSIDSLIEKEMAETEIVGTGAAIMINDKIIRVCRS